MTIQIVYNSAYLYYDLMVSAKVVADQSLRLHVHHI